MPSSAPLMSAVSRNGVLPVTIEQADSVVLSLQDLLVEDRDISEVLDDLALFSARFLSRDREVLCGVTMRENRRSTVVASSSEDAWHLDEVQAGFGEGPCLQAQETGEVIAVPDTARETRWPGYMTAVKSRGLRSILAVPLEIAGGANGAMNFYTRDRHAFDPEDAAAIEHYVKLASKTVTIAHRIAAHAGHAADRKAAMQSRTVIDVAVGILMAQNRCSQDEAFTILQRASSNRNVKVRDLAENLVKTIGQSTPTTAFTG